MNTLYKQKFGYYQNYAAVENHAGEWFHVDNQDDAIYKERYAWCGNFQNNFCVVKDSLNNYFHIDTKGKRIYSVNYIYAGDHREGSAVVCNKEGLRSHIDTEGKLLHGHWFLDLDVFHKGIARAKDQEGWFHINKNGEVLYPTRYKSVDNFYNNVAFVETLEGDLLTIGPLGKTINIIKKSKEIDSLHQISAELIGFWKTQAIYTATKLNLFNYLPNNTEDIVSSIKLSFENCCRLLRGLQEMNIVELDQNQWNLTSKGQLLKKHLLPAALMWGSDHYQRWANLYNELQEPQKNLSYFENLSQQSENLRIYHKALSIYAQFDYEPFIKKINWSNHQNIIDAGGGTGTLLHSILQNYSHLKGILLDKPEVINLINAENKHAHANYYGINLFNTWPEKADAIIFARVLHDWADEEAIRLLRTASDQLLKNGKIYILEMILPENSGVGGLLDLNMLVMTGGKERTFHQWEKLIIEADLKIKNIESLSLVTQLLIIEKNNEY